MSTATIQYPLEEQTVNNYIGSFIDNSSIIELKVYYSVKICLGKKIYIYRLDSSPARISKIHWISNNSLYIVVLQKLFSEFNQIDSLKKAQDDPALVTYIPLSLNFSESCTNLMCCLFRLIFRHLSRFQTKHKDISYNKS